MSDLPFCVIIPAHDEERVIARCLDTIHAGAPAGHAMQVIVAANGCSDRTVERARAADPDAVVLDIAEGSKTGAINAANAVADRFPRIYLDADVECDYASLHALAQAVCEPGIMTAAPAIRMDLSRCNTLVRAYYRVWLKQPFAREGKGGAGCYALSRGALEAVGKFPPVIADDIWILTRFPNDRKRFVTRDAQGRAVASTVHPPRTAREQVRVEARRQIGNRKLRAQYPPVHPVRSGGTDGFLAAFRGGSSLSDIAVFFAMKLAARLLAKWRMLRARDHGWARDESSRA